MACLTKEAVGTILAAAEGVTFTMPYTIDQQPAEVCASIGASLVNVVAAPKGSE